MFFKSGADSVVTVNESPAHYTPYWTLVKNEDGVVTYFGGQDIRTGYVRRQDFPQRCFAKNDLVFVIRPGNLYAELPSLYGKHVEMYVTSHIYDSDINNMEDWALTEERFKFTRSKGFKD